MTYAPEEATTEFENWCLSNGIVLSAGHSNATYDQLLSLIHISGLDPLVTGEFYQLIWEINRKEGIAVVMVSHDIESTVRYASHILHLSESVLFFGTSEEYQKSRAGRAFLGGDQNV